jgi:curved DNA-binding protein CbpA
LKILGDEKKRQQFDQFGRVDDIPQAGRHTSRPGNGGPGGPTYSEFNGYKFHFGDEFFSKPNSMKDRITQRLVCAPGGLSELCSIVGSFSLLITNQPILVILTRITASCRI